MYEEIGAVSEQTISQLRDILDGDLRWESHISDITNHQAVACLTEMKTVEGITDRWPIDTWDGLTLMRLPPGGKLYRHRDEGYGYHIPIETNWQCVCSTYENGLPLHQHLDVGKLYRVDRSIEHEAFNNGKSNRTHLIVLLRESDNE